MKREAEFIVKIADFEIDKPIIITHSEFEWNDETKEIERVETQHIYYEKKATTE